jgi:glycosyltransferase involved in cell wall biosynthesis
MEKVKKRVRFSIIIPTLDRSEILERALLLLEKQIDERDELIVVEGKNGPAMARNEAILKSRGEYLLFLNDDSFVAEDLVKRHWNFHKVYKGNDKALVGLTENHPDTVRIEAMKWLVGQSGLHFNYRFGDKNKIQRIPWYYLWTCNLSMKRKFVIENNLTFCEDFPSAAWEDIEFAFRAKRSGMKLYFDKQARVWHFHQLGFEELKSRFVSHGRGLYHLESKLPVNFLPFLVKTRVGRTLLKLMQMRIMNHVRNILESFVRRTNIFPNAIMQWLVIKWKSDGYEYERRRLSRMHRE